MLERKFFHRTDKVGRLNEGRGSRRVVEALRAPLSMVAKKVFKIKKNEERRRKWYRRRSSTKK